MHHSIAPGNAREAPSHSRAGRGADKRTPEQPLAAERVAGIEAHRVGVVLDDVEEHGAALREGVAAADGAEEELGGDAAALVERVDAWARAAGGRRAGRPGACLLVSHRRQRVWVRRGGWRRG